MSMVYARYAVVAFAAVSVQDLHWVRTVCLQRAHVVDHLCHPSLLSLLNQTLVNPVGSVYVYSDLSFITLQFVVGGLARDLGYVSPSDFLPMCSKFPESEGAPCCSCTCLGFSLSSSSPIIVCVVASIAVTFVTSLRRSCSCSCSCCPFHSPGLVTHGRVVCRTPQLRSQVFLAPATTKRTFASTCLVCLA